MKVTQRPIKPSAERQQRHVIAPPKPPNKPPSAPAPPAPPRATGGPGLQTNNSIYKLYEKKVMKLTYDDLIYPYPYA
jgi:hypothetical protein